MPGIKTELVGLLPPEKTVPKPAETQAVRLAKEVVGGLVKLKKETADDPKTSRDESVEGALQGLVAPAPTEISKTSEQREQVQAAVNFAKYLVNRYPQIDDSRKILYELDNGKIVPFDLPDGMRPVQPPLNYYLAGSLATTLLAAAEKIDICQETTESDVVVADTVVVPPETRAILAQFARPIGDIDYVQTKHYWQLQRTVQHPVRKLTAEEYQQGRAKYLWKGGGGPRVGDLPANAVPAVKRAETHDGIMCDPVTMYGANKFARVNVEGQDFYIVRPDTIIAYKVLHALDGFNFKPDKFNSDFAKLHKAIKGMYLEEELVRLTHDVLSEREKSSASAYEPLLPGKIRDLLARDDLGEDIRTFIGNVLAYDKEHGQSLGEVAPATA